MTCYRPNVPKSFFLLAVLGDFGHCVTLIIYDYYSDEIILIMDLFDFFIWRFTRDLISVPAPLNAHTALQLCSDYGLLLLLRTSSHHQ